MHNAGSDFPQWHFHPSRYSECHYAESRSARHCKTEYDQTICFITTECHYAECSCNQCHYAEGDFPQWRYDQSCYSECHMLRAVLPGIAKLNNTILLCNN